MKAKYEVSGHKTRVASISVQQIVSCTDIEYAIAYILENGDKITKKAVNEKISRMFALYGREWYIGLLQNGLSDDAKETARKMYPDFYIEVTK
jgi:hypothetical protein